MNPLDRQFQTSTQLGYAKALLADFLFVLDQPEEGREALLVYIKARAVVALSEKGVLA